MSFGLMDSRYNEEKGYYEILIHWKESPGGFRSNEVWEPIASHRINHLILCVEHKDETLPMNYTIRELLIMEGWTPPQ